ncbi:3-oxoacyl-[acyl-carrier-protein] synthase 3 [Posidoniimonas polymericola]|uniref:Beta-ketoacyl-[acyl-carrier-protein] synthase III n=1 Tax=Posidoniimonas polymericola TaxID=2528002 RepID=A0A5C5ZFT4_9BACT|nr:beta-ketoacyl-ACP synthase III [Posidoniimonas polymericola]TWT85970.1 3-oxoacyl-[acyl-carrier-protein] synthase 3 [Posidoniimonas polymericola]
MDDSSHTHRRPPAFRLMGVQALGTGSYLPENVVTNDDLARLGCDAEWIIQRTGIRERRHAPPEVSTGDLAVEAAQRAMQSADVRPDEIDLVVLGTFTPDHLAPQTATFVQDRLGLNCGAMDVAAACAGFMYALITGAQFVASGSCQRVLVIGADVNSRVVDPDDKKTFPLFGDGAGAVVLGPGSPEQGLLAATLGADGSGIELLYRRDGGMRFPLRSSDEPRLTWLVMEGRPVFKWAVRLVEDSFRQMLEETGRGQDDIACWIMHQANERILNAASDSMGIPRERVLKHLDRYGNTSAASIPIALDEAVRAGQIDRGDELMLCGFGAGLSWGAALWKW